MSDLKAPEDVYEWINLGIDKGWATGACATHDGIPGTKEENEEWDEGNDPCQPVLRIWYPGDNPDKEH